MITSFSSEIDRLNFICFPHDLNIINDDFTFFYKFNSFFDNIREHKEKIEVNNIIYNANQKIEVENTKYIKNLLFSNSNLNNDKNEIFIVKKEKKYCNDKKIDGIKNLSNSKEIIGKKGEINLKKNIFICEKEKKDKLYRKDAYFKHFKAIFVKYLKNKLNNLKDLCFPNFILNKFSTPNYKFTGNAKQIDNNNFLSWSIKEIFIYSENEKNENRQYNNKLLIEYIEKNEKKAKDKKSYQELIIYFNKKLENAYIEFYDNKNEFDKLQNDKDCIFFDKYFKNETGMSLLEKNGFLKVIKDKKGILMKNSI
jgi:hypothetical protein